MRHDIKGIMAMAATAVCWSLSGLFIKLVDWPPGDDRRCKESHRSALHSRRGA